MSKGYLKPLAFLLGLVTGQVLALAWVWNGADLGAAVTALKIIGALIVFLIVLWAVLAYWDKRSGQLPEQPR